MLAKTTEKKEGLGNGRTNETGLGQSESFQATSALWHFRSSSILRDSQFLLTPPVAGQSTVQYSTVQYSTVQYITVQYCWAMSTLPAYCTKNQQEAQRRNDKSK
jgi:hypothetical protein